jgi:flagella basal body P-ring formation protein FlgA
MSEMNLKTGIRAAVYLGLLLAASRTDVSTVSALSPDEARPRLAVPTGATIKGDRIILGEIGRIDSTEPAFDDVVGRLRTIDLGAAPAPMVRTSIPGIKILETIEQAGIPRDALSYSIPQAVTIERAGRQISNEEVISAVKNLLVRDQGMDIQVREVSWSTPYVVPMGATELSIERLGQPSSGRMPIRVSVDVDGALATRFLATALVDDWRAVPVVNRTLERGELISDGDISVVRMNMSDQPADLADNDKTVVGKRTKLRISAGAPVRLSQIDVPPAVAKGEKAVMLFEAAGLKVTAVGIALEDGVAGEDMNLKNETSGKIVRARVIGQSLVKVN